MLSRCYRNLDFQSTRPQFPPMIKTSVLPVFLLCCSSLIMSCATTDSKSSNTQIAMPTVQETTEGKEFIEFSFPSEQHGVQVVLLDQVEPYGSTPGSRQWRGRVKGDPNSKATLTQLNSRVFATIKSEAFGYYEIRGDAKGKLDLVQLSSNSYLGPKKKSKSQFQHN